MEAQDREVLGAVFASRVTLAKMTADEAAEEARKEHAKAVAWVNDSSQRKKGFLWFCDELDLDYKAVRQSIERARR